jgi:hypothetical protein
MDSSSSNRCRFYPAIAGCLAWLAWAGLAPATGELRADGPPSDSVTQQDRQFWSFQKVVRPKIPATRDVPRVRTPIDAFVIAQLERAGLRLSADAERTTLVRRLFLDLVGLPPTPEEVAAFLADESPGAYERLVDRLLDSPHYGERWARHWLDVAGYVDTVGFDVDPDNIITSEGKWKYRDYVIRALNDDRPYDRFLHEQLAGDELVDWRNAPVFTPEIRDLLTATGFLRTAADFTHEDVGNIPQNHFNILHDTLEIVSSSVLGLTLNCARCHNHKFDPLPQEDYYRLMAAFTPAYNAENWKIVFPYDKKLEDRTIPDVSPADRGEIDRHNAEIERQVGELSKKLDELRRPYRDKLFEAKLATLPEPIRADTRGALELPGDKRSEIQKYLAGKFEGMLKVSAEEIAAALNETDKKAAAEISAQTASLNNTRRSYGKIQALFDVGAPPVTRRLLRGNYETPGVEVEAGFLRVLCDSDEAQTLKPAPAPDGTSGRRLALARWLTAPDSRAGGLTARVMVNRVWQHLFALGIVPTPENFGFGGAPPTHPELLEWLSAELMSGGWRLKPFIRQIVVSSVYRQAADAAAAGPPPEADPDNKLLWRMRLKRLEGETIRDCVLASCGNLDATAGGPPIMIEWRPDGMVVVSEKQLPTPTAKWRRSVYLLARRAFGLSELAVFDQPVVATNCPERTRSAVAPQSLTMLNGQFLWEEAEQLAAKLPPGARDEQIARAFQRVLARSPSPRELQTSLAFLDRQAELYRQAEMPADPAAGKALAHFCHTLLNTSEFLYAP